MKKKTELREIAKDALVYALSKAYYPISDDPGNYGLTEEEADAVIAYMDSYASTMCSAIRKRHYGI